MNELEEYVLVGLAVVRQYTLARIERLARDEAFDRRLLVHAAHRSIAQRTRRAQEALRAR